MPVAAIPSVRDLFARNEDQAPPHATAPAEETAKPSPTKRAVGLDHKILRACLLLITVLLDITCILWVFPIADQIAEWAGVSLLNAIFAGAAAMLGSIPVVIAATVWAWKSFVRR